MKERVNFYVDGFNFYYGLKNMKVIDNKWLKFYWLDYVKFFDHFIGENQILQKVIYFAAPPPFEMDMQNRQKTLFNAPIADSTIKCNFLLIVIKSIYFLKGQILLFATNSFSASKTN